MKTTDPLSRSQEDYLEAIFGLIQKNKVARVTEIAAALRVRKSSVTIALRQLSRKKLIHYDPYAFVTLTDKGEVRARTVSGNHGLLKRFLTDILFLDDKRADDNACRIEHAVDETVLKRMADFLEFSLDSQRKPTMAKFKTFATKAKN
ncbi:MAG: hypothetical protein A2293_06155 [Elusimicrobia bacterium RIFOXYB2_FULL_49_7]|nr:MAG: hypothetical protein A2293_06155 [Elusimicrobia bacterium RIFOXYB2_FULL_49_7]